MEEGEIRSGRRRLVIGPNRAAGTAKDQPQFGQLADFISRKTGRAADLARAAVNK